MILVGGMTLNPRLVVFDKDGTLIAFDDMWHSWFNMIREELADMVSYTEELESDLSATLGYDSETGRWDPTGPLTLAATREVTMLIAGQLYRRCGVSWDAAVSIVDRAEKGARGRLEVGNLAKPIGDVTGTLERIRGGGYVLALATTDDRDATQVGLKRLGIARYFETMVCGDDGYPLKPAPDMALEICRRLAVAPHDAIMVGDTTVDLIMARQAGYGCAIGVTSGALKADDLAPHADILIPDIHALQVV